MIEAVSENKSQEKVVVCNENGLHIRPASMISQCAAKFHSKVELEANGHCVDARGIFDILLLAATKGTTVTITAVGPDHQEAVRAMANLFQEGFPFEAASEN
ncbi:MAG: HPr family phosphocarrier protein [Planctomycetia bacterium]|nr:HPr family phosphocarrier protein [Planctomycetia bacterium]